VRTLNDDRWRLNKLIKAVAIRRLIDPNPREVTEADATRIYRAVLEPA
jgi:alcohol dehydrogenase class IV